jgi:ergothioneine biosynthesis protein EgtB
MDRGELLNRYREVREKSEEICAPLLAEDYVVQPMADVSPPKWHLAHTTWFFEQLVLLRFMDGYRRFDERFEYLFNSYYETFGARAPRNMRGTFSRPSAEEVYKYRAHVDRHFEILCDSVPAERFSDLAGLVELGLHHEQQHQELLLTDIKYIFATNPLRPVYRATEGDSSPGKPTPARMIGFEGGLVPVGAADGAFAYDNERPSHKVFLYDFAITSRLVTCGEFLEFIEDGGYSNPLLWLSDGWDLATTSGWKSPLYWEHGDGEWQMMTLSGPRRLNPNEPVAHVSYYESDAFARWAGKRLPTEFEWETAAATLNGSMTCANLLESGRLHPVPCPGGANRAGTELMQMFGDVWEWTASAYMPYPGYRREAGALGEYNGKFMCNQMVLRGGSCVTPRSHIRPTYRNFFPPDKRWQFTGIRLASDPA